MEYKFIENLKSDWRNTIEHAEPRDDSNHESSYKTEVSEKDTLIGDYIIVKIKLQKDK